MADLIKTSQNHIIQSRKQFPKYFSLSQISQIIEVAQSKTLNCKTAKEKKNADKNLLLVKLLWQTGARISEVVGNKEARGLLARDVDMVAKTITFQTLKQKQKKSKPGPAGKKHSPYTERRVPVQDGLRADLAVYISTYALKPDDRLFPITGTRARDIVKDVCIEAGMSAQESHPHAFRHSFAVHCVLNRVPLPTVQKWLGHKSIMNTQIYVEMLAGDVREFYDRINWEQKGDMAVVR